MIMWHFQSIYYSLMIQLDKLVWSAEINKLNELFNGLILVHSGSEPVSRK